MPANTDETRMSFGDHLEELRARVIYALFGVAVTVGICLYYGREILYWLCIPLYEAQASLGQEIQIITLGPAEAFSVYLKVSIISGLVIAAPWQLYQLWKFVVAGLYQHERRAVYVLVPFSSLMVFLAIGFLYFLMLPICLQFFLRFGQLIEHLQTTPRVGEYIRFVLYLALGIVIGFQLPVAMMVGGWAGILDANWLSKYRGHALLACSIAGAVLTPSDPVSMMVLAVPLYGLFEVGLLLVRIVAPKVANSPPESPEDPPV